MTQTNKTSTTGAVSSACNGELYSELRTALERLMYACPDSVTRRLDGDEFRYFVCGRSAYLDDAATIMGDLDRLVAGLLALARQEGFSHAVDFHDRRYIATVHHREDGRFGGPGAHEDPATALAIALGAALAV